MTELPSRSPRANGCGRSLTCPAPVDYPFGAPYQIVATGRPALGPLENTSNKMPLLRDLGLVLDRDLRPITPLKTVATLMNGAPMRDLVEAIIVVAGRFPQRAVDEFDPLLDARRRLRRPCSALRRAASAACQGSYL